MAQLVEEVLTFSKAEANELDFNPAQLDVAEFCHQLVDEQRLMVSDRYILNFNPEAGAITAELDKQLLRHIVTNLLTNAIKYSPKGSTVSLSLLREDDKIIFRVEDHGIGIPKAEQKRLFSPFFRATNVSTTSGTGMGLSIVKKCVDLHGGEIVIESDVGVGTLVTVTLPFRTSTLNLKP